MGILLAAALLVVYAAALITVLRAPFRALGVLVERPERDATRRLVEFALRFPAADLPQERCTLQGGLHGVPPLGSSWTRLPAAS